MQINCNTEYNHRKAKSNQQTTVRSVHYVCAHNTAQKRLDSFPSYLPQILAKLNAE